MTAIRDIRHGIELVFEAAVPGERVMLILDRTTGELSLARVFCELPGTVLLCSSSSYFPDWLYPESPLTSSAARELLAKYIEDRLSDPEFDSREVSPPYQTVLGAPAPV